MRSHVARWRWIAVALLAGGVAAAQPPESARSLFEQGMRLLDDGETAAACVKLGASARLEPKVATKLALASCYERLGRTASAWSEYVTTAKLASDVGDSEWQREMVASERARILEKKLVRLMVKVDAPVAGLQVRRGSELLTGNQLGAAVPVDPGEIVISATAPGFETWTVTVRIAKQSQTVVVPPLRRVQTVPEG